MLRAVDDEQDLTIASAPDHGGDARATAVLDVLGGVAPDTVAEQYDIPRQVLDLWIRTFVTAGREGVAASADVPADRGGHQDRYLGLIAHELRSPLAMIRGWTDLLGDAADESQLQARAVAAILAQITRLQRLAEDALDGTSVTLGRLDLQLQPDLLGQRVAEVVAARSGAVPSLEIEEDVRVMLDRDRFGQIIDNLLDNARKHGQGVARVVVRRQGDVGEVIVTSPGDPIPDQIAERMFEPFARGTAALDGVGLGLYICRSLVVAHGGQIGVRVERDANHFWFGLPVA